MAMLLRTVIEKAELFFGAWEMGNFILVTKKQSFKYELISFPNILVSFPSMLSSPLLFFPLFLEASTISIKDGPGIFV